MCGRSRCTLWASPACLEPPSKYLELIGIERDQFCRISRCARLYLAEPSQRKGLSQCRGALETPNMLFGKRLQFSLPEGWAAACCGRRRAEYPVCRRWIAVHRQARARGPFLGSWHRFGPTTVPIASMLTTHREISSGGRIRVLLTGGIPALTRKSPHVRRWA